MWVIGFLVTPTLFSELESRVQAGALAGILFGYVSWIGLLCAGLLLALLSLLQRGGLFRSWRAWCVAVMFVVTVTGQFVVTPRIQAIKARGADAARTDFARWHAVSSSLFVVNSLLGLILVVAPSPRPERAPRLAVATDD